jgi:hypothetical protein
MAMGDPAAPRVARPLAAARATLWLCLIAAIAAIVIVAAGSATPVSGDIATGAYLVSPYVVLAVLAQWRRRVAPDTYGVLATAALASLLGLYCLAIDSLHARAAEEHQLVQRAAVAIVPLGQLTATTVLALLLFVRRCCSSPRG